MPTWFIVLISFLLACAPVILWSRLLLRKTPLAKKTLFWIFIGGSSSVVPIFFLQWLWGEFPVLDVITLIETKVVDPAKAAILVFIFVGIMEEIVKQAVVRAADRRHPELMQTVNNTLTFSIASALGFAFAEDIFYFYNIWINLGIAELFSSFVFRSIFTAAGHMIFSGIFGYYFGIAKFASDMSATERYAGKRFIFSRIFGRIFGLKTYESYRQQKILKGLFLAIGIHAVFNFLLEMNLILPVIVLILMTGAYVYYLMHRIAGNLLFSFEKTRPSTIAPRDEDVVIELLGMWTNEGKCEKVMEICNRVLARDPDNNVVRLFRAKAADNAKLRTFYESLRGMFQKTKADATGKVMSELPALDPRNEEVVAEVLGMWFKEGDYKNVISVARKLLARNPNSEGAEIILKKALNKEKLEKVFNSLKLLFEEPAKAE